MIIMKRSLVLVFAMTFFLGLATPAFAEERKEPSAEEIILDTVLIRPLGIVSIVVGIGGFAISLPFTIPTNTVGSTAKRLIEEPFLFTFKRPIGEF